MPRDKYETKENLTQESMVANMLSLAWNSTMKKMANGHAFDYCALRGDDIQAFVEIKCRSHKYDVYPDVMLSMTKLQHMRSVKPCPVILVVKWTDRIGYVKLEDWMLEQLQWGGRTKQTRDQWDIEPITKIKLEHFKLL